MILFPEQVSMTHWMVALLLLGLNPAQPRSSPQQVEGLLRELAAGRVALQTVRLETQCLEDGRFLQAAAHGTGVAIWNGERQGSLTREQVLSLVKAFVREGFARMPASFGEEKEERRMAVKMTCRVRFSDGRVAKDVIQLDEGRQSPALKRLARGILDAARAATRSAAAVTSLDEGLAAIADGRLAVETLRITMRAGVGTGVRETTGKGGVLRIDGRDLHVEPDAGAPVTRRLEDAAVRELARVLADSRFFDLPVNVRAPEYVDLTVSVLGQEHSVQARQFSGAAQDPALRARFERAVAPLTALFTGR